MSECDMLYDYKLPNGDYMYILLTDGDIHEVIYIDKSSKVPKCYLSEKDNIECISGIFGDTK